MNKNPNSVTPKVKIDIIIPDRRKKTSLTYDHHVKNESTSVIYGMEKDSIAYLSEYIKNHPRMKDAEMHRLACKYFYLKQQFSNMKDRLSIVDEKLAKDNDDITHGLLVAEKEELNYLIGIMPYDDIFKELQETLIAHNLRLILKIANSYAGKGLSVDDLIQEGVFGFLYAIDRYDPNKNVKLGTYATWWVKQKITRALSNKARLIRLPVHLTIDITKVLGAIRRHNVPYSHKTVSELAKLTKMKESNVSHAFSFIYSYTPYNQIAMYNNEHALIEDPMTDIVDREKKDEHLQAIDMNMDHVTFCLSFLSVLDNLLPLEKEYICKRYGLLNHKEQNPIELKEWLKSMGIKQPVLFRKTALAKIANEILK
jgi:RNA polymerase nonessential primary-like sigma factor